MENTPLQKHLPRTGITIISGYGNEGIEAYVALYELAPDNGILVNFPKGHRFVDGQRVTLHLDNRTGVDEYDADLRVYRMSYKGIIVREAPDSVQIRPEEFKLIYSNDCVNSYEAPGFSFEEFDSPLTLPESPVRLSDLVWSEGERENKLGVLISRLPSRPHTSLMAFLSSSEDDVFLITLKNLFKSRALHYDRRCAFAIDHRADFVFEKAYDWNYTIISADAFAVSRGNPLFEEIQYQFVSKNPWESSFFMSTDIEMFHLKPRKLLLPEGPREGDK